MADGQNRAGGLGQQLAGVLGKETLLDLGLPVNGFENAQRSLGFDQPIAE